MLQIYWLGWAGALGPIMRQEYTTNKLTKQLTNEQIYWSIPSSG